MSYDLALAVKVHGAENLYAKIARPDFADPTYNVGTIIRKCTGWDFKQGEWYRVKDVLPLIERGIHEMRVNAWAYKQYEPENGWGSTKTVLEALESLLKCIYEEAESFAWDGCSSVPIEHLYVKW